MFSAIHAIVQLVLVFVLVVYLCRRWCPRAVGWGATAIGLVTFVAGAFNERPQFVDYDIFLAAGRDVLAGRDPYLTGEALNTPQALAFFAAAAALPPDVPRIAMFVSFLIGAPVLVWLGAAAVRPVERSLAVPPHVLGLIAAVLALSFSYRYGMEHGQLGLATAAGLLGAVAARRSGRPVLAGCGLLVGSLKIGTMLPFLALFRKRSDVRAWLALAALGITVTLLANPPDVLLERCGNCLALIQRHSGPDGLNDVARTNSSAVEIVSFERLFYCFGFAGAPARAVSAAIVAALGAFVLVAVARNWLDEPALIAVVSVYAVLFLYHRVYDTVLLAGAFIWSADKAVTCAGRARWAALSACGMVLGVWFPRFGSLRAVEAASATWHPALQIAAGAVLSYTTWVTVAAGALIVIAARNAPRDPSRP